MATAGGRHLFVAQPDGVERYFLAEEGTFVCEPSIQVGWSPSSLRWNAGALTGSTWNSLFIADVENNTVDTWNFQSWYLSLDRVVILPNKDVLVPFGEYGADRLHR